jgi:hypothetical protein
MMGEASAAPLQQTQCDHTLFFNVFIFGMFLHPTVLIQSYLQVDLIEAEQKGQISTVKASKC